MGKWAVLATLAIWLASADGVLAQNPIRQNADPANMAQQPPPAYPDQPVIPPEPSLRRRTDEERSSQPGLAPGAMAPQAGPPQPPPPPFTLTPAEETRLDRVLLFWEQSSQNVKTFRCKFTRWEYTPVWGNQPRQDEGELRYTAPDKAVYAIEGGRAREDKREEKWICDGKSIFQYDFQKKQVIEHRLPPELQGKSIANGPVPFLFGAKAEQLKRRYWLRIVTPPDAKNEVWLEAHPRTIEDAQSFKWAEVILAVRENEVQPSAVQVYHPNGKDRTVYAFRDVVVNKPDLRHVFEDPFHARVPSGWQKVLEEAPQLPSAAQRPAPGLPRR